MCSFAEKLIKATKGEKGIVEPTFVYLPGVSGGDAIKQETGCEYFSVPIELGVCGLSNLIYSICADIERFSPLAPKRPSTPWAIRRIKRKN